MYLPVLCILPRMSGYRINSLQKDTRKLAINFKFSTEKSYKVYKVLVENTCFDHKYRWWEEHNVIKGANCKLEESPLAN